MYQSNTKTIVFLETSLTHLEAREILPDADYRPSVKKGDVLRAIQEGYTRIAIIDGNFGWTPAVWHKEILIALDYGIEVWGASSMGALRAAELDVYGMQGVGVVYDYYKTGVIDGDDEVAIVYFACDNEQTVPLINIRLTLDSLALEEKESILKQIRSIYYAERTWSKIALTLPAIIYQLIYENYTDIKQQDARLLLQTLKEKSEVQHQGSQIDRNRAFTLFEKNLIESVFMPDFLIENACQKEADFSQLMRAKNLIKLLGQSKKRNNLRYYQFLISQVDSQQYTVTKIALMEQVSLFREDKNLLLGQEFNQWLIEKYLLNCNLQQLFVDYIKLKKYFLISYNYNHFFP